MYKVELCINKIDDEWVGSRFEDLKEAYECFFELYDRNREANKYYNGRLIDTECDDDCSEVVSFMDLDESGGCYYYQSLFSLHIPIYSV